MTNRDPNRTEFMRLFMDYYECYANYFSIPDEEARLHKDLQKPDINLVCYYEKQNIVNYLRSNPCAIHKQDLEKLDPKTERDLINNLKEAYKL